MGWDAEALKGDKPVHELSADDPISEAFQSASEEVGRECGSYDCDLLEGGLTVSTTLEMLNQATDAEWYTSDNEPGGVFSPEEVRNRASRAHWDFDVPECDLWALRSAQAFLRVCVEHDLGVYASC